MNPVFIVMAGDGINCERETALALRTAGVDTDIVHINDLIVAPHKLASADGLVIPGGFSFGDELGSGQILALKMRHKLGDAVLKMVEQQKPVIGICNGFQVLVKLGLLPFPAEEGRVTALAPNQSGGFIDRWVQLKIEQSVCLWTQGLGDKTIDLPIRHGEGRIVFKVGQEAEIYARLQNAGQIALTYSEDVNGSYGKIAALTDPTGVVLGMMPHPEAYMFAQTFKTNSAAPAGDGALIFNNMMRILQGRELHDARRIA